MRNRRKFTSGQVVCIVGMDMPMGAVVLKLELSDNMWLGTVEQDNGPDDMEFSVGELRRLSNVECGVGCPDRRGHHFGSHSDLCHNKGCNASRGTYKWCQSEEADEAEPL
jgi:hypothetical protein